MPIPTVTAHGRLLPTEPSTSQALDGIPAGNSVSTSAASTARQTAENTQVHGLIAASHLQYLERKIQLLTSQMDSYIRELENDINLIDSKMSSFACNLDNRIQLVNDSKDAHSKVVIEIEHLKARKDCNDHDVYDLATGELINEDLYAHDEDRQIELLSARKDLLASNLVTEVLLLKSTNTSYVRDLNIRTNQIYKNIDVFYFDITKQSELLEYEKGPFALDFDRQIEMLNSKLASFRHDYGQQEFLLISKIKQYSSDLREKMRLVNRDMISYLGQDFQL